jgi:hypothetical protein
MEENKSADVIANIGANVEWGRTALDTNWNYLENNEYKNILWELIMG